LSSKVDFATRLGAFDLEVRSEQDGGALVLTPREGRAFVISVQGDTLSLRFMGPELRLEAPDARLVLAAREVELQAEERLALHAGQEVDVHSGVDVELRADRQVNLWGRTVRAGD
jgi:hypothetical protein